MWFEKLKYYSNLFLSTATSNLKRSIYTKINFEEKLIGLKGAKGVGKTTIIKQYLTESDLSINEKLYITLDNPLIEDITLLDIVENAYKRGIKLIAFDEIHYQLNFEKQLKTIYDYFDIKIIFSGSSAIALSSVDLSRRAVIYEIPTLSFREYLYLKLKKNFDSYKLEDILNYHEEIAFEIIKDIKPLIHFEEYLKYGAYPFFLESSNDTYMLKLLEVINKVVENELLYLFNIDSRNVHILKKLLLILCENPPGKINLTRLSREAGINIRTLHNYINALEKGKLIKLIYNLKKGNSLLQKPDKILLDNPNLFYVLCYEQNKGALRESFFISSLKDYSIRYSKKGDYVVNNKYVFEIGGKSKTNKQIKDLNNAYVVKDDILIGTVNIIPLWLFGFLY